MQGARDPASLLEQRLVCLHLLLQQLRAAQAAPQQQQQPQVVAQLRAAAGQQQQQQRQQLQPEQQQHQRIRGALSHRLPHTSPRKRHRRMQQQLLLLLHVRSSSGSSRPRSVAAEGSEEGSDKGGFERLRSVGHACPPSAVSALVVDVE
ncbi:hypothetical protein Esti_000294 [Eimeria stiedai]